MTPAALRTERLELDQLRADDTAAVTRYCQDPLFEKYLTTPWPYERHHAEYFIETVAPGGWADGSEHTWAIRHEGQLVGVIGYRSEHSDLGFWMGRQHRGRGYMVEAVGAVADRLFETGCSIVRWECFDGNAASAAVARRAGFTFAGYARSMQPACDGTHPTAWQGTLSRSDDRGPKPGWPQL